MFDHLIDLLDQIFESLSSQTGVISQSEKVQDTVLYSARTSIFKSDGLIDPGLRQL